MAGDKPTTITDTLLLPADRWNRAALVLFLFLWFASCIKPPHPEFLLLQHGPTIVAVVALVLVQNRLAVSRTSYTLVLVFLSFHLLGARYLYTYVPYDRWLFALLGIHIDRLFGFERNNYDRLVHFLFGLTIVIPSYRFARGILALSPFWSAAVAFSIIMAASGLYEIIEWLIAVTQTDTTAEAYNGQQGDIWDPQKDMALAGLGALVSLGAIALRRTRRGDKA